MSPGAKAITIRPFTYTVYTSDWSIAGEKKNELGNIVKPGDKTYIEELEMVIPLSE